MSKTSTKPKPQTNTDRLDAVGIEAICERIEAGETYRDLAASIGVGLWDVSKWLNTEKNQPQSARAREASAESWLDKGLDVISTALPKDGGIDASAARAYAQECARRAAIRNPKYRERTETAVTGADGGAIKVHDVTPLDGARRIAMALAAGLAKLEDNNG